MHNLRTLKLYKLDSFKSTKYTLAKHIFNIKHFVTSFWYELKVEDIVRS